MFADEKGPDMGTADLHGSTIQIETGKGEKTTFELVRVGTLKEFETVKAALATSRAAEQSLDDLRSDLAARLVKSGETRVAAEAAYKAEKENSTALAVERGKQDIELTTARDDLESAHEEYRALHALFAAKDAERESANSANAEFQVVNHRMTAELDAAHKACDNVNEQLREEKVISAQLQTDHDNIIDTSGELLTGLREELAARKTRCDHELEGRNTALQVSQKELCESREEIATFKSGMLDALTQHVETHETWLDSIREMLAGE